MTDLFSDDRIREQVLSRDDILRLASKSQPACLVDCDLEDADLADVDLIGWEFERCNLRRVDFSGATLENTEWRHCRGAFAKFV
ncbi:MAG: pentapeptide repeat-containing protein, partial [Parasphingorhabdus sp.]